MNEHGTPAGGSALAVRQAARAGTLAGQTAGLAPGFVQVNLVILPEADAAAFLRFCTANPRPCPLLAVSEPGERGCARLGADLDIARDVPRYRVFRDGALSDEPTDVAGLWRDDLVTFALGCSFTFEHALLADGIPLRHVAEGRNVAMYRSSIELAPAGPFGGAMVVSMRPLAPAHAIRAVQICTRYPQVHGAPLHLGDPAAIGIDDLARPDYGEAVTVADGELPVFWACGVTPQRALERAGLPFAITHSPGHMLVTDIRDHELALM
ncbi:putative hydro-lyase [wastewater metagenome]|uniref:Putative hydro-lyase n=2 Tax=unclassified sequences TaxID=12908 RepID=A0A5B8R7Y3_9ZZZZ|nr:MULTISPECIES: putative hydro-lyase [Arhodomonas]QEA04790.1 putative hydro-lyase [uncultured organism]